MWPGRYSQPYDRQYEVTTACRVSARESRPVSRRRAGNRTGPTARGASRRKHGRRPRAARRSPRTGGGVRKCCHNRRTALLLRNFNYDPTAGSTSHSVTAPGSHSAASTAAATTVDFHASFRRTRATTTASSTSIRKSMIPGGDADGPAHRSGAVQSISSPTRQPAVAFAACRTDHSLPARQPPITSNGNEAFVPWLSRIEFQFHCGLPTIIRFRPNSTVRTRRGHAHIHRSIREPTSAPIDIGSPTSTRRCRRVNRHRHTSTRRHR